MRAGAAALCDGIVWHHRLAPVDHRFEHPVAYVWLDPDLPDELTAPHPLWSHRGPAPARFRRRDYGDGSGRRFSTWVGELLADELGMTDVRHIRMLTQVRRWGWLFNPITVYLAWDVDPDVPVAIVLEVTNTPWGERHHYVSRLVLKQQSGGDRYSARLAKSLHVSPFLDERFEYVVEIGADHGGRLVEVAIDVVRPDTQELVLATAIVVDPQPVTRRGLGRSLRSRTRLTPTHRASAAIYLQAMRLWRRGVVFVPHPAKRGLR